MNYEQIAIEASKVFVGVGIGTVFTTWYKDFKQRKIERRFLLMRMIASKGYIGVPQSLIDDLNTIEIIFRKNKKVLGKYHAYYEELCQPDGKEDYNKQQALYWDLLRSIGDTVGYRNLDNSTLNSRYIPRGVYNDHIDDKEFRKQLLQYLKSGNEMQEMIIENMVKPPSTDDTKKLPDEPKKDD